MSTFAHNEPSESFALPSAPESQSGPVKAWPEAVSIPAYLPAAADRSPVFSLYPFPAVDRIATEQTPSVWQAIHLENEFLRLMILPEQGGRIHLGLDKTNGYEFFYRQNVIEPPLAGSGNPCASGGVVFHWPQDGDPAACLPVSAQIEEHPDGSKTVWCSHHHPVSRMKAMHGVCLYPGRAYLEIKVRLFNRTSFVQSFLWSAHATVRRHKDYQWFSGGSSTDFSSGYDHDRQAGLIYVADRHVAPAKRYVDEGSLAELTTTAYTRNLSDLSFLAPYETKAFSQFWYPIQKIGPAQKANVDAAVSLEIGGESAQVGVCVTRTFPKAAVALEHNGNVLARWTLDLHPGTPRSESASLPAGARPDELTLKVSTAAGRPLISYTPGGFAEAEIPPQFAAAELPPPRRVETVEDLYLIGSRLQQDRNAARQPDEYWREGLRRNGRDSRCNNALGIWHLQRGDFIEAEAHFRQAIATLTARNPNSYNGEPFYGLGLALRYQERDDEAYDAFYQATWSFPWRAPALYAIAEIDTKRGNYGDVPKHLHEALRLNADNNQARNLAAMLFRRFGRTNEAEHLLRESLAIDPLDAWACHLSGRQIPGDNQTRLDLAFDYAHAGLYDAAIEVLTAADTFVADGSLPVVHYALASFYTRTGDLASAQREYLAAAQSSPDHCFPHRIEEMVILARAVALHPHDARAQYYLANLLYSRGRREEAMELWESSAQLDGSFATVWRNLGISYYNVRNDVARALEAVDKAVAADSADSRILYERDQLWKRAGVPPAIRLRELEAHQPLIESRDDLRIEFAALLNDVQQPIRALALLSSHQFQPRSPWESPALEQYRRTHLKLGRQALNDGDPVRALSLFLAALQPPPNFGGAEHTPAGTAEIWFWLGEAHSAAHELSSAQQYWRQAADLQTGVQSAPGKFPSEMAFYSGLALARLGERFASRRLLRELWFQGRKLARERPEQVGDSSAALPATCPFREDLVKRNRILGLFLQAQGRLGLGQYKLARRLLSQLLALDPNHGRALDLLTELPQEG
jgi:tetratricopeptide (TPR) repeat protein